jgi:hypothetical protein
MSDIERSELARKQTEDLAFIGHWNFTKPDMSRRIKAVLSQFKQPADFITYYTEPDSPKKYIWGLGPETYECICRRFIEERFNGVDKLPEDVRDYKRKVCLQPEKGQSSKVLEKLPEWEPTETLDEILSRKGVGEGRHLQLDNMVLFYYGNRKFEKGQHPERVHAMVGYVECCGRITNVILPFCDDKPTHWMECRRPPKEVNYASV